MDQDAAAGRNCGRCGRPLSRYNKYDYCGPCASTDSRPADARADIAPPADLGARLRAARERRGMPLETLGGLCGVSGAYICMIETGKRRLDRYSMILSVANALRIPPSELLGVSVGSLLEADVRPADDSHASETRSAASLSGAKRGELAARRKVVGYSQEYLAELLRVDRSTIGRWESGETAPQPWIRPKLAKALRVTPDQLNDLLVAVEPAPVTPDKLTSTLADGSASGEFRASERAGSTKSPRMPNKILRRIREEERRETRQEFADAMTHVAARMGMRVAPSVRYVARLEDGDIRYPHPSYRRVLAELCERPFTELGFARPQRIEITESASAEMAGERQLVPDIIADDDRGNAPQLEGLRQAILGLKPESEAHEETSTLPQLEASVSRAHALYQRANYDAAADLLPLIIHRVETPGNTTVPPQSKAAAYLAVAKLATKMGQNSLSWIAADRSLRVASETGRPGLIGIANYQVACALLGSGHITDAEQIAALAADYMDSHVNSARSRKEDLISAQGALFLLLAIIAARRGDRPVAKNYLLSAGKLAERLGRDDNWLWTGFGPTNIAIHELGVQVELGDSGSALQFGQRIDTDSLPAVLRGRRSQLHLELAWASVSQRDDGLAVLHLLEAERIAEQAVSRNVKARALLTTLMSRERKGATPGLRALAARVGII